MKSYRELISELSKKTLNTYLDKNEVERRDAIEKGDMDKARKRITGANKAITKVNTKIDKERRSI
jgi:hypothetical protein